MAPGISSALALAGLALGVYVRRNFRSRGAITARRPRVPASVILFPGPATPEPTVGISSRLHQATGLRHFSQLFYGC
jgi:hypothetical protein